MLTHMGMGKCSARPYVGPTIDNGPGSIGNVSFEYEVH